MPGKRPSIVHFPTVAQISTDHDTFTPAEISLVHSMRLLARFAPDSFRCTNNFIYAERDRVLTERSKRPSLKLVAGGAK